jgi:hypothetical protein
LLSLLADVLDSVMDERTTAANTSSTAMSFQQFIALIFITYSSTIRCFTASTKTITASAATKDMDRTPLYVAIGRELRRLIDSPCCAPKPNSAAPKRELAQTSTNRTLAQMWATCSRHFFMTTMSRESTSARLRERSARRHRAR